MSAPRFTPGPWRERIATGTCDHMIRSDAPDARASICVIPYKYGTPDSRNANAALIMAAPDLYGACEDALRWLDAYESAGCEEVSKGVRVVLRAALRKAGRK